VDAEARDDDVHQPLQRHEGEATVQVHGAVRNHLQRVLERNPAHKAVEKEDKERR